MRQTLKATAAVIGIIAAGLLFWIMIAVIMCIADAEGIQL